MHLNWDFLNSNLKTDLEKRNENDPNTVQICFETFNWFKVRNDMHLNWRFLKFQFGIRFGEKKKITQIYFETFN